MDQDGRKTNQASTSGADLREFDFEDIITDDLPAEETQDTQAVRSESRNRSGSRKTDNNSQKTTDEYLIKERRRKRSKRRRTWKVSTDVLSWVKDLVLAVLVIYVLTHIAAGFITMDNTSMEPTFSSGEHLLYSRLNYKFTTPGRGEIIVFRDSGTSSREHVSRVIGLPGDTISIDEEGNVTVNGIAYTLESETGKTLYVPGQITYPYAVPEDSYFVLCDNPNATSDSRYANIGAVPAENILGKVVFVYWPRSSWRPVLQGLITEESN